jgi:hypothetical protein
VGGQIEQLGQASEQQSAAIEKLWEAVSNIQTRQPAIAASAPTAALEPTPTPRHAHTHAAAAPPPAPAPPQTPRLGAKALGQLQLQHFVEKKLPSYDELEK